MLQGVKPMHMLFYKGGRMSHGAQSEAGKVVGVVAAGWGGAKGSVPEGG